MDLFVEQIKYDGICNLNIYMLQSEKYIISRIELQNSIILHKY